MGKSAQAAPPPDYANLYESGIKLNMKYLPQQLAQELQMRQQYDPQYLNQALGLQAQYDPQLATQQLNALQRRDPQWMAMHQNLGQKIGQQLQQGYVDPQQAAAYKALGSQVTSDTLQGAQANPAQLRDMTQAILSRQPTLSSGAAQDMAAAVYTGQRGTQLEQQRQQAANQFLTQQSPEAQANAQAGSYLSSPSQTQMINTIQGVTPPTANQYVNPQAGNQAAQFGLQNYQNQLASQQMGSGNPWTNALQGAGVGAQMGSVFGGYGSLIGGAAGGLYGGLAG
jgi:hypothetical protein